MESCVRQTLQPLLVPIHQDPKLAESFPSCCLGFPAALGAVVGTKSRKAVSPRGQGQRCKGSKLLRGRASRKKASKLYIPRTDRPRPSVPGLLPVVVRFNILSSWKVRAPHCPLKCSDETSTPPQPWQKLKAALPCPHPD